MSYLAVKNIKPIAQTRLMGFSHVPIMTRIYLENFGVYIVNHYPFTKTLGKNSNSPLSSPFTLLKSTLDDTTAVMSVGIGVQTEGKRFR